MLPTSLLSGSPRTGIAILLLLLWGGGTDALAQDGQSPTNLSLDAPSNPVDRTSTESNGENATLEVSYSYEDQTPNEVVITLEQENGSETFTYTVTDGDDTDQATATLDVTSVNDPPTVTLQSSSVTISEDTDLPPVDVTVNDVETSASTLSVAALSSDESLVPNEALSVSGSGGTRSFSASPALDAHGSVTITIEAEDGEETGSAMFDLTITPANDAPTLSTNAGLTLDEDTEASITSSDLSTSDVDDPTGNVRYTVTSTPSHGELRVGGAALSDNDTFTQKNIDEETVTYHPSQNFNGSDSFRFSVSDGKTSGASDETFSITVDPINDEPTISSIPDQQPDEDTQIGPLNFSVSDAETPSADLSVSATSNNSSLVPADSLKLGGNGSSRTITPALLTHANGDGQITVIVEDQVTPGRSRQVVWSAVNDFPRGLSGSGNRLRLAVEPAGGNSLYWVLGSALAAGAGATAAVLGVFGGGGGGGSGGGDLPTSPPAPPN